MVISRGKPLPNPMTKLTSMRRVSTARSQAKEDLGGLDSEVIGPCSGRAPILPASTDEISRVDEARDDLVGGPRSACGETVGAPETGGSNRRSQGVR